MRNRNWTLFKFWFLPQLILIVAFISAVKLLPFRNRDDSSTRSLTSHSESVLESNLEQETNSPDPRIGRKIHHIRTRSRPGYDRLSYILGDSEYPNLGALGDPENQRAFLGQEVNDLAFLLDHHISENRAFIVFYGTYGTYRMPDAELSLLMFDGSTEVIPGGEAVGYSFYPSKDEEWLFVKRTVVKDISVGYLYRRESRNRMVPVMPGGQVLTESALQFCASQAKLEPLLTGSRNTLFIDWDMKNSKAIFWVFGVSYDLGNPKSRENPAPTVDAVVSFDLKTEKFSWVKNPDPAFDQIPFD